MSPAAIAVMRSHKEHETNKKSTIVNPYFPWKFSIKNW